MKRRGFFIAGICSSIAVIAALRPVTPVVDFGVFHEEAGKKRVRAWVVNTGDTPSYISRVKVTCGCTAADYDKNPIAPGDSAWVDIAYNPAGRPGRFDKKVKIYGPGEEMTSLIISGAVIGSVETLAEVYPIEAGNLRLTENIVAIPEIEKGNSRHLFINAYNTSDRPVAPKLIVKDAPERALSVAAAPDTIPPGEIGTLSFYINTRFESRMGDVVYKVDLVTGDSDTDQAEIPLEVRVMITPKSSNFSQKNLKPNT